MKDVGFQSLIGNVQLGYEMSRYILRKPFQSLIGNVQQLSEVLTPTMICFNPS